MAWFISTRVSFFISLWHFTLFFLENLLSCFPITKSLAARRSQRAGGDDGAVGDLALWHMCIVTWPTWTGAIHVSVSLLLCQGSTLQLTTTGWHWLTLIPSSALSGYTSNKNISINFEIFQQQLKENILEHLRKIFQYP